VPISPTLTVQGDVPKEPSLPIVEHEAAPPVTTTEPILVENQLQVSDPVTTQPAEERALPITPIPMVLPPSLISQMAVA
jgi:hypothetical protein